MDEITEIVNYIILEWPFIDRKEAYDFVRSLTGEHIGPASAKISLWVMKKVIERNTIWS